MAKTNNPSPEEHQEETQNLEPNEVTLPVEENRTKEKFAEFHENLEDDELAQAEAEIEVAHNDMEQAV